MCDRETEIAMDDFLRTEAPRTKPGSTYCRKCRMRRPPRTHHCSTCDVCVVRMDHHCPWINSCIGIRTHKIFYLLSFYSFLLSLWIAATTGYTLFVYAVDGRFKLSSALHIQTVFLFLVSAPFLVLIALFLRYHTGLIAKNRTTLEDIIHREEKRKYTDINVIRRVEGQVPLRQKPSSPFDRGFCSNAKEVLGVCFLLWVVPFPIRKKEMKQYLVTAE
ncbi:MAG: palmitoyltransferase ZDHHC2 [Amphiamblys sp. WSBS2006]|nr:MAG: palmitoyltransferase ZDHHC2 [Amphiamblys sp. WSBS2006]